MKYKTDVRQSVEEFQKFTELAQQENVRSYLEIGCRFGGTLWKMANRLKKGSRIVAVDLPHDEEGKASLKACVAKLNSIGYDAWLFFGDSTNPRIVDRVQRFARYDLVFIDGNHEPDYVKADWNNYGPMGHRIAFHDITQRNFEPLLEVPMIWDGIKQNFRHVEFKFEKRGYGIGVLWR